MAQLAVLALQNALCQNKNFPQFLDCESLTLCADYQLPRTLKAKGVLTYDPVLQKHIDNGWLINPGSDFEIEIRMATIFSGYKIKDAINNKFDAERKRHITSEELDYWLWSYGRQLDSTTKHHLTRTIMY